MPFTEGRSLMAARSWFYPIEYFKRSWMRIRYCTNDQLLLDHIHSFSDLCCAIKHYASMLSQAVLALTLIPLPSKKGIKSVRRLKVIFFERASKIIERTWRWNVLTNLTWYACWFSVVSHLESGTQHCTFKNVLFMNLFSFQSFLSLCMLAEANWYCKHSSSLQPLQKSLPFETVIRFVWSMPLGFDLCLGGWSP